jgi:hypothetical protein
VGLAACAATVLPWTLRNWATFARPVLISTNACGVIGGANCPPTYGGDRLGAWELACLAPPSGDEAVDAATWCAAGIAYARAHPERWPAVVAARLLRTWDLWPGTFSNVGEGRLRRADRVAKAWLLAAVLTAAGGALRLRARGEPLWPLAAPIAMTSLAGVLGWGLPRLQSGAVPSIVVLAAVAVAPLLRRRPLARAA